MNSRNDWRPSAAYAYLLHLDGPALAWEYLRRNDRYRRDWQIAMPQAAIRAAGVWGLGCLREPCP